MGWATFISFLVFLGRFILDLSANTCQTHHVTLRPWTLTLEVVALVADTGLRAPSVTKFEVRPSRSEDMTHFRSQHYLVGLGPALTFDLWSWNWCAFGLPRSFCSRVMLRHRTDGQTDRQIDTAAQFIMPLPRRSMINLAKCYRACEVSLMACESRT